MAKQKLRSKHLKQIGFTDNSAISLALNIMQKHYKHENLTEQVEVLEKLIASPKNFLNDKILGQIALSLQPQISKTKAVENDLVQKRNIKFMESNI